MSQDLLVIDLETTGANPIRHDVLAVGLVPFFKPECATVVYVRPTNPIWSSYAQANFQKFADTWRSAALCPSRACAEIERWIAKQFSGNSVTPIAHNVGFDVGFLRKLAFLAGKDEIDYVSRRAIDTHTLLYILHARGDLPRSALSSDGAFAHFGIEVEEQHRHTALGDALATRELAIKLFEALSMPIMLLEEDAGGSGERRLSWGP
jgi:DNA polymerase III epsilon subunit-like protein